DRAGQAPHQAPRHVCGYRKDFQCAPHLLPVVIYRIVDDGACAVNEARDGWSRDHESGKPPALSGGRLRPALPEERHPAAASLLVVQLQTRTLRTATTLPQRSTIGRRAM